MACVTEGLNFKFLFKLAWPPAASGHMIDGPLSMEPSDAGLVLRVSSVKGGAKACSARLARNRGCSPPETFSAGIRTACHCLREMAGINGDGYIKGRHGLCSPRVIT